MKRLMLVASAIAFAVSVALTVHLAPSTAETRRDIPQNETLLALNEIDHNAAQSGEQVPPRESSENNKPPCWLKPEIKERVGLKLECIKNSGPSEERDV